MPLLETRHVCLMKNSSLPALHYLKWICINSLNTHQWEIQLGNQPWVLTEHQLAHAGLEMHLLVKRWPALLQAKIFCFPIAVGKPHSKLSRTEPQASASATMHTVFLLCFLSVFLNSSYSDFPKASPTPYILVYILFMVKKKKEKDENGSNLWLLWLDFHCHLKAEGMLVVTLCWQFLLKKK